jgi:nucleotide-binding universal stress UspA family protein
MAGRLTVQHILCPTDYSECSREAMKRAVDLAARFEARLTVLHVLEVAPPSLPPAPLGGAAGLAGISEDIVCAWRADQAAQLARFVAPHLAAGVPIECTTAEAMGGDRWRQIKATADALPADLIVMGTHGRTGLDRVLVGSVTEKMARAAPCPVLAVGAGPGGGGGETRFRRILCATDLEQPASPTVDVALALAEEEEDLAQVTLLHVVEELGPDGGPDVYRPLPDLVALRRTLTRQAEERLDRMAAAARTFCDITVRVETGRAWRQILRVAREVRADVVVVGAHTGGGLERLLLGSNANQVIRHAPCPVLVVRDSYAAADALPVAPAARGPQGMRVAGASERGGMR